MDITSIAGLRRQALVIFLALLWLQLPLIGLACWAAGQALLAPMSAGLALALLAQGLARVDARGDHARMTAAVAIMVSISILVGVMAGQKLQVDLHMYYFAMLAVLVAAFDWRVVAAGAATVAVHHAVLNFMLPGLIYPEGADVLRLVLHAVIVVLEAAILIVTALTVERTLAAIAKAQDQAEAARQAADVNQSRALQSAQDAQATRERIERERALTAQDDAATLQSLGTALGRLAAGDLTHRVNGTLPTKAEQLRADFNHAVDSLALVMAQVTTSTGHIRHASQEVAMAASDLSGRTERQAASLERTTAALGQVTRSMRQASQGAGHACTIVANAKTEAERSSEVVNQAVSAMTAIETSSRQIGQIIGVIDEIAFQTSLLALNAGVEAARAGDAGRGFAVVASEVRALAQRSAEAAKEIKALITSSTSQVGAGVELVTRTGQVLERIVGQVAGISTLVTEIASSAQTQATDLDEVNMAIGQMNDVTQQNAAMVEETTAATTTLASETDSLAAMLGTFQLTPGNRRPAVALAA